MVDGGREERRERSATLVESALKEKDEVIIYVYLETLSLSLYSNRELLCVCIFDDLIHTHSHMRIHTLSHIRLLRSYL